MAGLIRRGKYYTAVFRVGGQECRRALGTDSCQIAKERLRQLETEMAQGSLNPLPGKTPVADIITAYVDLGIDALKEYSMPGGRGFIPPLPSILQGLAAMQVPLLLPFLSSMYSKMHSTPREKGLRPPAPRHAPAGIHDRHPPSFAEGRRPQDLLARRRTFWMNAEKCCASFLTERHLCTDPARWITSRAAQ